MEGAYMTHFRHWLVAAALLPATYSSGLVAGRVHTAITEELPEQAEPFVQPHLQRQSGRDVPEPAGPGMIQATAAGGRPGLREAVLATHAVLPLQRLELGFALSHDAPVNGFTGWYGVYLESLDRVEERNTIYGLAREIPRFGISDGKTPTSLEQYANAINARVVSPTFFVYGMLRNRKWSIAFDDGWKLQAGVRRTQYSNVLRSNVGSLAVERKWESFRTSYSLELERSSGVRSSGVSMAPSHVLQFDYLYSPRDSVGVSFAHGREIAYFGPLGILNTKMRKIAFSGQHWFKPDWALTLQAGYNHHGDMPAQSGIRAGLRHSF